MHYHAGDLEAEEPLEDHPSGLLSTLAAAIPCSLKLIPSSAGKIPCSRFAGNLALSD
jgi:hypothetical protein